NQGVSGPLTATNMPLLIRGILIARSWGSSKNPAPLWGTRRWWFCLFWILDCGFGIWMKATTIASSIQNRKSKIQNELMTPALLGKKIGTTRIYDGKGSIVPVTVVQAGPCRVTQVKTADGADKYNAVQLGFGEA